jgi:hypothetical protein
MFRMDTNGGFGTDAKGVVKRLATMFETPAKNVEDELVKICVCAAGRSVRYWRVAMRAWHRSAAFEEKQKRKRDREERRKQKQEKTPRICDKQQNVDNDDATRSQSSFAQPSVESILTAESKDEVSEFEEDESGGNGIGPMLSNVKD